MSASQRDALRELLRRVDEVRGLSGRAGAGTLVDPGDTRALIRMVGELIEDLEKSHRRLIETNVQLVSLREVAGSLLTAHQASETTRTVTSYLSRAFGFEHAFLLIVNREAGRLEGTWTRRVGERESSTWLEVPLLGDHGAVPRALWWNRTVLHRDPARHPALALPDGHPLHEALACLGSVACVPLQRHSALPVGEPHELCGARCIVGDVALVTPPPGAAAEGWTVEREERQGQCLRCELMPILGVIGMARGQDAPPLSSADAALLESIALSIAPVVENARLYHELRQSERFRLHVLDSMASALVVVDMKGEILTFNRAAQRLLGFQEAEARGQPFGALLGEGGERLLQDTLEHGREILREETVVRAKDGTPVPVSLTASLLRNERRVVYGAIATFVDLTPLKLAEEHARSMDRLAALGRFTSSVAHEIRNPLTGIGAGVQYLARLLGEAPAHREHIDFILSEIRRLDAIVQDLFDITHPRQLQLRVAPLEDAARRALHSLEPLLAERRLGATLEIAPMTPPVPHDPDQIQQVFINLIKNAAEASPAGAGLVVSIAPGGRPSRGQGPCVVARVRDRGSGIRPEHQKTIFEPFFTTKPGGTGLGLYICHDIVKRHGGALTVHSEPGGGATFQVELPQDGDGGIP
jgi:PAS domain S-box-containing protein